MRHTISKTLSLVAVVVAALGVGSTASVRKVGKTRMALS